MPYFDMRQRGSNGRTWALAAILGIGVLYFLITLSSPNSLDPSQLVRKRRADAAAQNPLSPPTSAFRRLRNADPPGVHRPPPVVHYQLNNLTATADLGHNREKVLILTPLARFYPEYWSNLLKLSYPHEHISLGFITPKTREGDAATAALNEAIKETQSGPEDQRFQSVTILRQDFEGPASQDEHERHALKNQKDRRAAMSRARNSLLFTTIGPSTSWVLWLDSDIVESPPTLIQDLASHDKSIIVPNCFQRYYDNEKNEEAIRPYDYNSWQDSEVAKRLASKMGKDEIIVEGYGELATYRTLMAMISEKNNGDPRKMIPLDGVGGTALLVKAEVHRDGAMFPPFPFYNLIETEGFAKMASRLGYKSWGLPNYLIYHYNE